MVLFVSNGDSDGNGTPSSRYEIRLTGKGVVEASRRDKAPLIPVPGGRQESRILIREKGLDSLPQLHRIE